MAFVENIFQTDLANEITAVVAHNDAMAVGAMIALEGMGRKDILIAGIDANADMLGYLKEGRVAVTVFQDAAGQGKGAVEQAIKILNGEAYEHDLWIPYQLVNLDNADEFLAMYQ
jgi:ABC-type sugar transport system substrate-binding protein